MIRGKVLSFVSCLIIFSLAYFLACVLYMPMHFTAETNKILAIDKATSARALVTKLKSQKLIKYDSILLVYIKISGISKRLKAGVFEIHSQESFHHLLKRILAFDILKKSFQITPGITKAQLAVKLQNAEYLNYTASSWEHSVLKQPYILPNDGSQEKNFEGLYLADTYQYNAGSDAEILLSLANQNLKNCLFDSWNKRDINLPYKSPYELLIVASILEKESATLEDKQLISGVVVNRLRKNMPLQMDPTVIYGLKDKYTGKLSHADMQVVSEYNTYKHRGLPPTPIAMVSCESIKAASLPILTDYLYFVANGKGSHIFSKTYAEHLKLIR